MTLGTTYMTKDYRKLLTISLLLLAFVGFSLINSAQAAGSSSDAGSDDSAESSYGAEGVNEDAMKNYEHAMNMIDAEEYNKATKALRKAIKKDRNNADLWNMLGFTLRKAENYTEAMGAYNTALALDADHLGAHEYLGELYVQTDQRSKALLQLVKLQELCPQGCKQLTMLEKSLNK